MGRALQGLALVTLGEVAEGMRRLDEVNAAIVAGELHDLVAIGLASCHMIAACDRVRDYDRAIQWCNRLKDFSARAGYRPLFAVCRTQYASICMWRGMWKEAEEELTRRRPGAGRDAAGADRGGGGPAGRAAPQAGTPSGGGTAVRPGGEERARLPRTGRGGVRSRRSPRGGGAVDPVPSPHPRRQLQRPRGGALPARARAHRHGRADGRRGVWRRASGDGGAGRHDRPCARWPAWPQAMWRPAVVMPTRRGSTSRTRSTGSCGRELPSRLPAPGSSWRTPSARLGRTEAAADEARCALELLSELKAERELARARGVLESVLQPLSAGPPAEGPGPTHQPPQQAGDRGPAPGRGRPHEPGDRGTALPQRPHRAPPPREHPEQAFRRVAGGRGGPRGARRPPPLTPRRASGTCAP